MRRAAPVSAAVFLTFAAYVLQAVSLPATAFACSCMEPAPLAKTAQEDPVTIVAATVGVPQPDMTPIVVDTWFHGPQPTETIWLNSGTGSASSCDVFIAPGQRWLFVLWGGPTAPGAGGLYSTSLCSAHGMIGTPEGNALLEEAVAVFGLGQPPPSPEPDPAIPQAPVDLSPWLGSGLIWAAAVFGVGLLLLALVVLVARRRPSA